MTIHLRSLTPAPSTVDLDGRTVEAIVSTGADRPLFGGVERLDLGGADLSRVASGNVPVLDAHRASSTRDQLGSVIAAEQRPEGLWVKIKFRGNDAARQVLADIAEGALRGLSIGYAVTTWKDTTEGERRIRTVTKWTLFEVSVVPVPADAGAHFRNGEHHMTTITTGVQTLETAPAPVLTRAQINAEIRSITATAGLPATWADAQIDAEAAPDTVRRAAFDAIAQRGAQPAPRTRVEIGTDHTDPRTIATRAGEALYARMHPEHQLSDAARPFAYMAIPDLARDCLRRNHIITTGLSGADVITRALHSTSDLSLTLGDTTGRELRRAYEAAPGAVRQVARQTTARDFRAKRPIQLGAAPMLEKVNEGGEFKSGTIGESAESYRVETFGKIVGLSRQILINDDLDAFQRVPGALGAQAAAFVDAQLAALVASNPTMSDTVAVFDAAGHKNQSAATVIADDLHIARLAMRKQTGLAGELINLTPRFVLVPAELETAMEKALSEVQAASTDDANPFARLSLIVEPRLTSATQWYMVADPAQIDGLEYAYLEGAPGPQIETRAGFEVDGVQIKVRLDFGAGWIDHRGWYRVG